jgi:hypothetical protein
LAKAKATDQDKNHWSRFKDRREPQSKGPLGKPPKWIVRKHQLEAWQTFSDEVPWLNHSHRALVGIASEIRGRLIAGEEVSVNGLNLLRLCLGQMGATPVDSSKITLPEVRTTWTLPINTSPDLVSRVEIRAVCPLE